MVGYIVIYRIFRFRVEDRFIANLALKKSKKKKHLKLLATKDKMLYKRDHT
jgi:hypothetical protein